MELKELINEILQKGLVNIEDVQLLKSEIYADGIVDSDEINMLVSLRNEVTSTCPEFEMFFFEAAQKYLLADEVIDEDEVLWIREVIYADGVIDDNEKAFLKELKEKAKSVTGSFDQLLEDCGIK